MLDKNADTLIVGPRGIESSSKNLLGNKAIIPGSRNNLQTSEVLLLIMQTLKSLNLAQSLQTLEKETGLSLESPWCKQLKQKLRLDAEEVVDGKNIEDQQEPARTSKIDYEGALELLDTVFDENFAAGGASSGSSSFVHDPLRPPRQPTSLSEFYTWEKNKEKIIFLIYEQYYLELLFFDDIITAIQLLQFMLLPENGIVNSEKMQKRVHELSSFLLVDDFKQSKQFRSLRRAGGRGKAQGEARGRTRNATSKGEGDHPQKFSLHYTRKNLYDTILKLLPSNIMTPPNRFVEICHQALKYQELVSPFQNDVASVLGLNSGATISGAPSSVMSIPRPMMTSNKNHITGPRGTRSLMENYTCAPLPVPLLQREVLVSHSDELWSLAVSNPALHVFTTGASSGASATSPKKMMKTIVATAGRDRRVCIYTIGFDATVDHSAALGPRAGHCSTGSAEIIPDGRAAAGGSGEGENYEDSSLFNTFNYDNHYDTSHAELGREMDSAIYHNSVSPSKMNAYTMLGGRARGPRRLKSFYNSRAADRKSRIVKRAIKDWNTTSELQFARAPDAAAAVRLYNHQRRSSTSRRNVKVPVLERKAVFRAGGMTGGGGVTTTAGGNYNNAPSNNLQFGSSAGGLVLENSVGHTAGGAAANTNTNARSLFSSSSTNVVNTNLVPGGAGPQHPPVAQANSNFAPPHHDDGENMVELSHWIDAAPQRKDKNPSSPTPRPEPDVEDDDVEAEKAVTCLAFSTDGKMLLGCSMKKLWLWTFPEEEFAENFVDFRGGQDSAKTSTATGTNPASNSSANSATNKDSAALERTESAGATPVVYKTPTLFDEQDTTTGLGLAGQENTSGENYEGTTSAAGETEKKRTSINHCIHQVGSLVMERNSAYLHVDWMSETEFVYATFEQSSSFSPYRIRAAKIQFVEQKVHQTTAGSASTTPQFLLKTQPLWTIQTSPIQDLCFNYNKTLLFVLSVEKGIKVYGTKKAKNKQDIMSQQMGSLSPPFLAPSGSRTRSGNPTSFAVLPPKLSDATPLELATIPEKEPVTSIRASNLTNALLASRAALGNSERGPSGLVRLWQLDVVLQDMQVVGDFSGGSSGFQPFGSNDEQDHHHEPYNDFAGTVTNALSTSSSGTTRGNNWSRNRQAGEHTKNIKQQKKFSLKIEKKQEYYGHTQSRFILRPTFGGKREEFVIIGSETSVICVWHKELGTLLCTLKGHASSVSSCLWVTRPEVSGGEEHEDRTSTRILSDRMDDNYLFSISDDRSLRVWAPKDYFLEI
ncbi:unnamed protein product [Amoebophrya sp. A120]|nr:unnamed protein product [Amoebophrya sp. A120]|eukprot:GSA120T00016257001.1